jgi:hypothetical protein
MMPKIGSLTRKSRSSIISRDITGHLFVLKAETDLASLEWTVLSLLEMQGIDS